MERIHFEESIQWPWLMLLGLSLIFILVGIFDFFTFENTRYNGGVNAVGYFLIALYFLKSMRHKNYVHWNKKGIVIRNNSYTNYKTLKFDEIKAIEQKEKTLMISKRNGSKIKLEMSAFFDADIQRLKEIIMTNSISINR